MNKPLPTVVCNKCNMRQTYNRQEKCTSCGKRLNDWSINPQLESQAARKEAPNADVR